MIHIRCHNPQQAYTDIVHVVWPAIKGHLLAGGRPLTLEVKEEKRSDAENRLLHAMLGHIAMMRSHGQDEYADYARGWYWNLLGPYIAPARAFGAE